MVNRRMFRPGFADVKEQMPPRPQHGNNGPAPSKKPAPPEMTHAENFYWVKQMQARTPMAIVLDEHAATRSVSPKRARAGQASTRRPSHATCRGQVPRMTR